MSTELTLKIIMLGSSYAGKRKILQKYFNNDFVINEFFQNIGYDFYPKFFKFEGKKIKVNYIDTASQENFRSISINYLKGTDGAIFVFDITQRETFELLDGWLCDIKENNQVDISKILIGNNSDLSDKREVQKEEAEKLAENYKCKYFEVSTKTGENINEAIDEITRITYLNNKDKIKDDEDKDNIILEKEIKTNKKKCL